MANQTEVKLIADYSKRIEDYLHKHGPQSLSAIGGEVRRPPDLSAKLGWILKDNSGKFRLYTEKKIEYVKLTSTSDGPMDPTERRKPDVTSDGNEKKPWLLNGVPHVCTVRTAEYLAQVVDADIYLKGHDIGKADSPVVINCECTPDGDPDLVVVVTRFAVYVIDATAIGMDRVSASLRSLMHAGNVMKIFHGVHLNAVPLLSDRGASYGARFFDTQLAAVHLHGAELNVSLHTLAATLGVQGQAKLATTKHLHAPIKTNKENSRPRTWNYLEQAAARATLIWEIQTPIMEALALLRNGIIDCIIEASLDAVRHTIRYGQTRSICFNKANGYKMSSRSLMSRVDPAQIAEEQPCRVRCGADDLIFLLSHELQDAIRRACFETAPERYSVESDVSDIVLDVGRKAHCWIRGQRVFLHDANDKEQVVRKSDLDNIRLKLCPFRKDRRAGLDGQLHRISAMFDNTNQVIGLTLRVGRSVSGNAGMVMDVLLGSDKSVLFLGDPGSGKTTVVREATRILAEERNVIVVDTSNEIGGDGVLPHACIGHARRMMVPSLEAQSDVMIECLQNHTPHVMVIDEIGRPKEVQAAATVKQRGVRLIASAHGDFRSLLKNRELRNLIGGVETVTVGDETALRERRACMSAGDHGGGPATLQKMRAQRAGEPTFQVIVEMHRGKLHEWHVITDVAAAVDAALDKREFQVQERVREPDGSGLRVTFVTG
jgi:stage III sporulation protein SpoIIIAA